MPAVKGFNATLGVSRTIGPHGPVAFDFKFPRLFQERNYTISGVTKDSTGAALGSCIVRLFNTDTNEVEQTTTSDASGNYSFIVDKTKGFYCVSYKTGSPDVAGTTVNTLAGA